MDVLVIGSGGREHALIRALHRDPDVRTLYAAPGNPGIAQVAEIRSVATEDPAAVADLARRLEVDLVVIGPEGPLVAGVADGVRDAGIACFGPGRDAARLEGSKAFAKQVMADAGVPTARSEAATGVDPDEVLRVLDEFGPPYVVKADGLAAGKGVVVTTDRQQALAHAEDAGSVVVEEYLGGPEVSLFAITDGSTVLPLLPAQDFKRLQDQDTGPNTGGMGASAPLDWLSTGFTDEVLDAVLHPTVDEMRRRGAPFVGLLYAGLALTPEGVKVVEFNARFGDPETQVLLPLLRTPLSGPLYAAATGTLADIGPLDWSDDAAVTVVLAAAGYPSTPSTGDPVTGLEGAERLPGVHVDHAGIAAASSEQTGVARAGAEQAGAASAGEGGQAVDDQIDHESIGEGTAAGAAGAGTGAAGGAGLVSAGGRVLAVTAVAPDTAVARERAYQGLAAIDLPGGQYRTDIAVPPAIEAP